MLRELGIESQPEELLRRSGADCRESASRGRCCGFGGLFSVKLPEASVAMADEILDAAISCGANKSSAATVHACCISPAGPPGDASTFAFVTWPRSWKKKRDHRGSGVTTLESRVRIRDA
jgi:L-lactate dehydrogenase complex protein LldE